MALKDQFLGLVSHELRTPVATILGNALLLLRRDGSLPEGARKQALEDVAGEAQKLQRTIENLLLLTRLEAGPGPLTTSFDMAELAGQAAAAFLNRNPGRPVTVDVTPGLPAASGQPALVAMVLENLLANAAKYSADGLPVEVSLSTTGGEVLVSVRDYGIGLDAGDEDALFTPFFRSSRARGWAGGIGLGLAVCKRVIEAQQGRIWAVARPEGGCDFRFALPVTDGPGA
jgi:signal transduction histidine kinase